MIERYQLRYFLAVVEAGTFSRAAQQVNVTQPTLSVGIGKLERAVGAPLFVRNSKRVHLTPAGSQLLAHARAIEREFNAFETAVRPGPVSLPVRLGVLATLPTRVIEAIVRANAAAAQPDLLEIVEGREGELASRLERRRIDLALTLVRPGDPRRGGEPLHRQGYALALCADHPLAGREAVTAESLAAEVMIVRRNCEALQETSRFFTERGVRPRFSFRTHNDDRAAAMVRAGLGVTVAPDTWREPGVRLVRLAGFDLRRDLGLVWSEAALARAPAGAAVRAVRAAMAELGD